MYRFSSGATRQSCGGSRMYNDIYIPVCVYIVLGRQGRAAAVQGCIMIYTYLCVCI